MFFTDQISLLSLSTPWDPLCIPARMTVMPSYLLLSDVDHIPLQQDIALQDKEGKFVGKICFADFMEALLNYWKRTESYYKTLLLAVDDAVTVINQEGHVVAWNPKSEEMYGCKSADIMGKPITDYFREESLIVISTLNEQKPTIRKYNQPRPGVHVLINSFPVFEKDTVIGGISVERDISDVVKLHEELTTTTAYIHDLESKMENTSFHPFHKIKGRSALLRRAMDTAQKVSITDASVLLTGESGVGKELFAEAIHKSSHRAQYPFIGINCGAIPAALFESELFGYEKGAFTGAVKEGKKGKIDAARGGTLFLDEIGEMPMALQVKLLRVLQERQFYRIGGNSPIPFDVRIIAATNRDLEEMINHGQFREDLYYRLNVVSIQIPPLRERIEDIPELIQLYLKEFSLKYSKPVPNIDPEVLYILLHHPWKGNIRQLRNTMERIMILVDDEMISMQHLPHPFLAQEHGADRKASWAVQNDPANALESEVERIRQVLRTTFGNKAAAAKLLGFSRATLYNKLRKYKLE